MTRIQRCGAVLALAMMLAQSSQSAAIDIDLGKNEECPPGFAFKTCGTSCPQTCANFEEGVMCNKMCVSGCFCPQGMILDEEVMHCVATPAECQSPVVAELGDAAKDCASLKYGLAASGGVILLALALMLRRCIRQSAAAPKVVSRPSADSKVMHLGHLDAKTSGQGTASPEEVETLNV